MKMITYQSISILLCFCASLTNISAENGIGANPKNVNTIQSLVDGKLDVVPNKIHVKLKKGFQYPMTDNQNGRATWTIPK